MQSKCSMFSILMLFNALKIINMVHFVSVHISISATSNLFHYFLGYFFLF